MGRLHRMEENCPFSCGQEGVCQEDKITGHLSCFCPFTAHYPRPGKTCDDDEIVETSTDDIMARATIPENTLRNINNSIHVFESDRIMKVAIRGTDPPEATVNATERIEFLASPKSSIALFVAVSVTISVMMIVLSVASIILWRKNKCRFLLFGKSRDSILDKNSALLKSAANPNYYACPETSGLRNLKEREIPKENLIFLEEIGQGCFGKVYKGELKQDDDAIIIRVAIKVLKEGVTSEAQSDFEREVEILSTFDHENIVRLLGVVLKETGESPWMVFEYMELGDLAELLRSRGPRTCRREDAHQQFSRMDLIWIAAQIGNGMVYLASQHFVHRDLAARNCLVGSDLSVKISDFGMSRDIYTCDYYKIGGSRLLPVRWMAPESVMYGKFTMETDVWSYGIVLWEIFTHGKQPYYGHSNEEVVKLILQGILPQLPDDCPTVMCELMAKCWKTDPKDRINFPKISVILKEHVKHRNSHSFPEPESPIESPVDFDSDPIHTEF